MCRIWLSFSYRLHMTLTLAVIAAQAQQQPCCTYTQCFIWRRQVHHHDAWGKVHLIPLHLSEVLLLTDRLLRSLNAAFPLLTEMNFILLFYQLPWWDRDLFRVFVYLHVCVCVHRSSISRHIIWHQSRLSNLGGNGLPSEKHPYDRHS